MEPLPARCTRCDTVSVGKWDPLYGARVASVFSVPCEVLSTSCFLQWVCDQPPTPLPCSLGLSAQCALWPRNHLGLRLRPTSVRLLVITLLKHGRCTVAGAGLRLPAPHRAGFVNRSPHTFLPNQTGLRVPLGAELRVRAREVRPADRATVTPLHSGSQTSVFCRQV